jgi:hypothetical protein
MITFCLIIKLNRVHGVHIKGEKGGILRVKQKLESRNTPTFFERKN